jgi:hypothetical protein
MRVQSSTRFAAMAALIGGLACAGNTAREADTDESAAARDTTVTDTLGADTQNPPGYRGMERDTTIAPTGQQPSDTFLQNQGVGAPQDTAGYTGAEQVDTTGQANQPGQIDTTSYGADTTSMTGADTTVTGQDTTSMTGQDTSWTNQGGDTTGYNPSQQPQDTASSQ